MEKIKLNIDTIKKYKLSINIYNIACDTGLDTGYKKFIRHHYKITCRLA